MNRLFYKTVRHEVGVSIDKPDEVRIELNGIFIAKFQIHDLWDMLRDHLKDLSVNSDEIEDVGLDRRATEALAAYFYGHAYVENLAHEQGTLLTKCLSIHKMGEMIDFMMKKDIEAEIGQKPDDPEISEGWDSQDI